MFAFHKLCQDIILIKEEDSEDLEQEDMVGEEVSEEGIDFSDLVDFSGNIRNHH